MRHLIIGAGATIAQAKAVGCRDEYVPPAMHNFARKMWEDYSPYPFLNWYLQDLLKVPVEGDARPIFFELESSGRANVEQFIEYAWQNRDRPGARHPFGTHWDSFMHHGIGERLTFLLLMGLHEDGAGWKTFSLSNMVASHFSAEDLVLSLNYDPIFELGMEQHGRGYCYLPNHPEPGEIPVCKPHGTLNMAFDDTSFCFSRASNLGGLPSSSQRLHIGLIPPRMNKSYDQHPISQMILAPVWDRKPDSLIFWGIGFTGSDADLDHLYQRWAAHCSSIEVVNPDPKVAASLEQALNKPVSYFPDIVDWLGADKWPDWRVGQVCQNT